MWSRPARWLSFFLSRTIGDLKSPSWRSPIPVESLAEAPRPDQLCVTHPAIRSFGRLASVKSDADFANSRFHQSVELPLDTPALRLAIGIASQNMSATRDSLLLG
jgi:hypothetical protein